MGDFNSNKTQMLNTLKNRSPRPAVRKPSDTAQKQAAPAAPVADGAKRTILTVDHEYPFSKLKQVQLKRKYDLKLIKDVDISLPAIQNKKCAMAFIRFPLTRTRDFYEKYVDGIKKKNENVVIYIIYDKFAKAKVGMFNGLRIDGLLEKPIPDDKLTQIIETFLETE